MNLDQYPLPPDYRLLEGKPDWKALPPCSIMLTPMGWVMPLNNPVHFTHDGPVAVREPSTLDVLEQAYDITCGDRQDDYGDARESFSRIAAFWSIYLDFEISPQQVAQMMTLLKISRSVTSPKRDTFVDQAGYTRLAYLLSTLPTNVSAQ